MLLLITHFIFTGFLKFSLVSDQ